MALPEPLQYQTPPPPSSRAALVLFIASIVAFTTFFLILPPLITLVLSLRIRKPLLASNDDLGLSRAGAAFASSAIGSTFALLLALGISCGSVIVF